ncbi:maltodextrin glucosidase MalZ [Thermoclostridium stercorarium subsp. stercorarium DSM 8532]|jgi:alpha-glucosidase|uniref:Maltodextrin glucosidase MalZ n=3 Tax=Thermoclostridium stercorarium TaxID=1510 RepID=L7VQX9_THES1|nr:alpha amylase N-terminal ig-like domain-containing protein [Thermoclostridium stercorarium]AGC67978.1 maltodextrin glucosidase MalZ [Thermoclostridium stercorarium subsp. stercorarium DSM 8532]AGI39013.1 amylase [Thermoclostridium stercorarium subsp. stercorarium DSM 8532]ANW98380.1 alpha-glycosidase [Thermoclostridium stercorarium subsp. thermolacticum DSM 2910]ANX00916.1 alpha-glycosidase [Thermoclostridium stercorarium subsp. leptospartum DSM 9219]UZQ86521.1 alpha amylase N-terminal ig-l
MDMKIHDWKESIYSDGSEYFVSNPNPALGENVLIKLRVFKWAPVKAVVLRYIKNGGDMHIKMEEIEEKGIFKYYGCEIKVSQPEIHYHFLIGTDSETYYYTQLGLTDYSPAEEYDFRIIADYECPEWVKKSVFYHIFPDRFHNGNPENDVKDNEYFFDGHPTIKKKWNEKPCEYEEGFCLDFFGGDLEGIREKIPYLKELGVNALYINPIFRAATNHKYDCIDYFNVDPHFGGNEALVSLSEELHRNGMKIILDVSINHTGTAHKWFNKDGEFFPKTVGAYNNPDSEEREFYYFDNKNNYHAWFGVKTLPTLNYRSQKLRDIIYRAENSVVRKWLKPPYNIDGWRFDVGFCMARMDEYQMHQEVWREIRKSIKEVNPRAYIVGEHMTDSMEFLRGDMWDACMNYFGFGFPVRWFAGENSHFDQRVKAFGLKASRCTAERLANMFMQNLARLPYQMALVQYNMYDSHDISRLHNHSGISYETRRGVIIMQFTFPGAPAIYYGDEISINGTTQSVEGCRYPMVWDEELHDKNCLEFHKVLCQLKQREKALQSGGFKILYAKGYVISYARFTDTKAYIVVCSQEDKAVNVDIPAVYIGVTDSSKITEVFGRFRNTCVQNGILKVELQPYECLLYEVIF